MFSDRNPLWQFMGKLGNCFYLSVLWLLCSLPVITMGAAFSALYRTAHKIFRNDGAGIAGSFFASFRQDFRQATGFWLCSLLAGGLILGDLLILDRLQKFGALYLMLRIFLILLFLSLALSLQYIFPYIGRFSDPWRRILANCAAMALRHLPRSLLSLFLSVFTFLLCYLFPILILILPGAWAALETSIIEKIFARYRSEEE